MRAPLRTGPALALLLATALTTVAAVLPGMGDPAPPRPTPGPPPAPSPNPQSGVPSGARNPQPEEFFEARIRPLLHERCFSCHAGANPQGRLLLTSRAGLLKGGSRGPAVVPGHPEQSLLLRALRRDGPLKMPPTNPLAQAEIDDLAAWIQLGAPWPKVTPGAERRAQSAGPNSQSSALSPQPASHWAFRPVRRPALPKVKNAAWVKTPVDAFILAKLEAKGLSPSPAADRRTLIRRATFDLTGLPPTPEEIDAFLADRSPDAWVKVVDRLLASPRYGERWGRYWLDVARYADTKGYVYTGERRYPFAYTYRDWVIRAFNEDLPYDRFLLLQIAADQVVGGQNGRVGERENGGGAVRISAPAPPLSHSPTQADLAAMGFLTLGRRFVNMQPDIIDDRLDVVFRGTQALTVGCARCHDHKFDPIPTADYYSLYGVFAGGTERTVPIGPPPERTEAYLAYEIELNKRLQALDEALAKQCGALSDRLRAHVTDYLAMVPEAAKLPGEEFYVIMGADDVNPIIARSWRAYVDRFRSGRDPIWGAWHAFEAIPAAELPSRAPALAARCAANADRRLNPRVAALFAGSPPAAMAEVAARYGRLLAGVHEQWQALLKAAKENGDAAPAALPDAADEALRQALYAPGSPATIPRLRISETEYYFDEKTRNELNELQAKVDRWHLQSPVAPPQALILEDLPEQHNPRIFLRGNPSNKGDEVPRRFILALAGPERKPFAHGSGRLDLARAIASPENPLTARVMVNRVWQHHFGQGLVRTPSDFGHRSEPPTHPELLDWLAFGFATGRVGEWGNGRIGEKAPPGSVPHSPIPPFPHSSTPSPAWRLKPLHRLLMRSATYQQSSEWGVWSAERGMGNGPKTAHSALHTPHSIDPDNRLLWRMNRQRLDFEALRDSLLFASGQLDPAMGGPSVDLLAAPFSRRRAVYGLIDRQNLPGLFRVFDVANPDRHSPQRYVTTSPQQALFMLNSPFVLEQARHLVARPETNPAAGPDARIERLYRLLYGRAPTAREAAAGLRFLEGAEAAAEPVSPWQYGWGALAEGGKALGGFQPLPHFTGEAWQGGPAWPDPTLGWLRLTAAGGHAGKDAAHAVVRRWVAPADADVTVSGTLRHGQKEGDGVEALLFTGDGPPLARWEARNTKIETAVPRVAVRRGQALDFVVACRASVTNDAFEWAPRVRFLAGAGDAWDAARDFAGPALTPWEQYAQALLLANEFVFVD